jgi:HemY protein
MRFSLWAVLALLLGSLLAQLLLADRGYVLIDFRGYVVEMSVPGLVLALLALYLAIRAVVTVGDAPRRVGEALVARRLRRGGDALTRGLVHMIEGDAARGERLLTQALRTSDAPLVGYLLAARAAQQQGARERRDQWLKLAADEAPGEAAAVLMTQAELQLDAGETEAAKTTVERLTQLRPDHPAALGLRARLLQATDDTPGLVALLPRLGRARLAPELRKAIAARTLRAESERADFTKERLAELWGQLSGDLRAAPALLATRAVALQRLGRGDEAERELRSALKRNWDVALVRAYGEVRGADPLKQLQQAETWLKSYPEDSGLLLTAARLCMVSELWGKARSYLESSLALAPDPDAYALYGRLLAELGEGDRAAVAFRSGLGLVSPAALEHTAVDRLPTAQAARGD